MADSSIEQAGENSRFYALRSNPPKPGATVTFSDSPAASSGENKYPGPTMVHLLGSKMSPTLGSSSIPTTPVSQTLYSSQPSYSTHVADIPLGRLHASQNQVWAITKEVPVEKPVYVEGPTRYIDRPVEVPVNQVVYRDRQVEVPVEKVVYRDKPVEVEKIVTKEVPYAVEVPVTVTKNVPFEVIKEVPVERIMVQEIPVYVDKIVFQEVPVPVDRIVYQDKLVEVERLVEVEKKVPTIVERVIEVEKIKEVIKEVPVEKIVTVEKIVEVPGPERIVEKIVEVVKEVPVEKVKIVEVTKEVPVEKIVYRDVDKIVEKTVVHEVTKEVPVEKIVYKEVFVDRVIEKIVEVPTERIILKDVPVEVQKVVKQDVTVEVEKVVDRVVYKEREPEPAPVMRAAAPPPPPVAVRAAAPPPAPPVQAVQVVREYQKRAVGLGLQLQRSSDSRTTYVHEIIPGFAAMRNGRIQVGDIVVSVDSHAVDGWELEDVKRLTVGEEGTLCTLELQRGSHFFFITLERHIPEVVDRHNFEAFAKTTTTYNPAEGLQNSFSNLHGTNTSFDQASAINDSYRGSVRSPRSPRASGLEYSRDALRSFY